MSAGFHILAFGFAAPWLMAAGAAATSIPIIIHLLNKRKFRIIIWAAMEWLLAAQRRNARRLRFQRWILLLIRCLALLIIAAGIAQLFLQTAAIAGLFGQERAIIIVWDDSYSMGYQHPGAAGSPFEKSRRLITDWLDKFQSSDKVMVIRASRGGATGAAAAIKPTTDHGAVRAQVAAATLTDASTDLAAAFDQAAAVLKDLKSSSQVRQVIVLTDLSRSSLYEPEHGDSAATNTAPGATGDRLKKAAASLKQFATDFRIMDLGSLDQVNMAVTEVRPKRPAVVSGVPAEFDVTLLNATDRRQVDIPITVSLDGVVVRTDKVTGIEPGARQSATVEVTIPTVGRHMVEARLPGDGLPADDIRRLMVNVQREIPILLVDGSPGDGGRTSYGSTAFLWAAYTSSEVRAANIFAPKIITELELPTTPLTSFGAVILSDTGELSPALRDGLKRYVEAGGLLMIFPGNHTNAQRLNETFGDAGLKLLPATLGQPVKLEGVNQLAEGIPFATELFSHDVVSVFKAAYAEGKQVGFTSVRTTQYFSLGVAEGTGADTVLRYAKPDGTPGDPAVVLKQFGQGRAVLFASSADTAWNNWGAEPSFLPFMHELTYYAMTHDAGDRLTLRVLEPIDLPAEAAPAGTWSAPHDARINVTSALKDGRARLSSPPLTLAGPYGPTTGDVRPVVVVNPDPEEADIRHVTPAQMSAALGIDPAEITTQPVALEVSARPADAQGWAFGSSLIGSALLLFAVETVLAMFFSMYR